MTGKIADADAKELAKQEKADDELEKTLSGTLLSLGACLLLKQNWSNHKPLWQKSLKKKSNAAKTQKIL
jgi:hypothetical protein